MRSINEIKAIMTNRFINEPAVILAYGLATGATFEAQFSAVSLESILFDILAFCVWTIENILNITIIQQNAFIKSTKIHSLSWYSDFAKKFQFGYELPWGEVVYNNEGEDESDIATAQVVKFAAVTKVPGGLRVKVAGIDNDLLAPITSPQFLSFQEYMFRISAAGDNLFYTNNEPDSLRLHLKVWYDALVLNSEGKRLDGTNDTPVADAIENYIKGMDFNGRFVPALLTDVLQKVEGVKIPEIELCKSQYAALPYVDIEGNGVVPDAGYLRIINPTDLQIEYAVWQG